MTEAEKKAKEINDNIVALKEKVDQAVTPEQLDEAKKALTDYKGEVSSQLEDFVKADDFKTLETKYEDLNDEFQSYKEGNEKGGIAVSFKQAVSKAIQEKHEELKQFFKKNEATRSGSFEISIKAPGVTATTNITPSTAADIYASQNTNEVSEYPRDQIFVEQYLDTGNTGLSSIPYVDELPGEGDAAIVAEGSLKPLIDVDYQTAYSQARKVAGRMKATEEALFDYGWLESAMQNTLKKKHDISRQNDIIGVTNGLQALATAFNASILGGITVQSPQYYDVLAALVAGMVNDSQGYYVPNVIFVNTLDNLKKQLIKDNQDNYVMPPFSDKEGNVIDNVRIVAKPNIPVGTFIIGDFKNVKLRNLWGYTVRFGWENDDFGKNQITMVGESRYHLYATTNDRRGIITGTFADVITALTPAP